MFRSSRIFIPPLNFSEKLLQTSSKDLLSAEFTIVVTAAGKPESADHRNWFDKGIVFPIFKSKSYSSTGQACKQLENMCDPLHNFVFSQLDRLGSSLCKSSTLASTVGMTTEAFLATHIVKEEEM